MRIERHVAAFLLHSRLQLSQRSRNDNHICPCHYAVRKQYDVERIEGFAKRTQYKSHYRITAAVRAPRFAKTKAKGNFAGENMTDADVGRTSIWIFVRGTDRPLSISEAAVSAVENCVTLSASLRRAKHVDSACQI